jgi:hypothetical protein
MIPIIRKKYNEEFKEENYQNFLNDFEKNYGEKVDFRIAETPIFISKDFQEHLKQASNEVLAVIKQENFKELTKDSIPKGCYVPKEDDKPQFLVIDFAICKDEKGDFFPQLIELQGFPSLYGFQEIACQLYKKHFNIPENFTHLLNGLTSEKYYEKLGAIIFAKHAKENVILLEIEPHKQKTRIDFQVMHEKLGLKSVCISELILENKKLYYLNNGKKTPIHRIYNRVIFDELEKRTDLKRQFNLTEEVEVEWAGHPNWFFRISKYTVPFIKSKYVPKAWFLNELQEIPTNLEDFVLKPLFSFAGAGVIFNVSKEDIDKVKEEERPFYLLQEKVQYTEMFRCPKNEAVKAEIRMLFLWNEKDENPEFLLGLSRLSKGVMIGVNFNKDRDWVGGTGVFFEK